MGNLRKIIMGAVVALGLALAVPGVAASEDQLVKLGKYEAASFDVSGGGFLRNTDADPRHTSKGSFLELYGSGITPQTATITVETPADITGAAVRVAGDRCVDPAEPLLNPWPYFTLAVDGTRIVSGFANSESWSTAGGAVDLPAGLHTFLIRYRNDFVLPGLCDRNLRVDHIIVAGPDPTDPFPRVTWAPVGATPLSDSKAASLVTHRAEDRPDNTTFNNYVPTDAELAAFHSADGIFNPLTRYVTGRPGLSNPSTDDLIQWAAQKWGIPEDWLRAEYVLESNWHQSLGPSQGWGDARSMSESECLRHPSFARIDSNGDGLCDGAYESLGITQVKWRPSNSPHPGTEPLRWKSTAFNIDYQAATVRYYYDGRCTWCGPGYGAGQAWNSIGAWFNPTPWLNSGQLSYIARVQSNLANVVWEYF